jgi:hypothetical protein
VADGDGQQYDTTQLDTVQHPVLGPLKFPKEMPFEERNQHIDKMLSGSAEDLPGATPLLKAAVTSGKVKAQPKTEFEKSVTGEGVSTKGAGTAAWETLGKMVPPDPTGGHSIMEPEFWLGENRHIFNFDPEHSGIAEAGREAKAGYQRAKQDPTIGTPIGESIRSGLGSLLGVSASRQAEHAAHGEGGKIIGETGVPAATAIVAPIAGELAMRGAGGLQRGLGNAAARILRDPATGKVTVTPSAIAERIIPQRPEILEREAVGKTEQRMNEIETARQKELADKARMARMEEREHSSFAKRLEAERVARQKELADAAKFREDVPGESVPISEGPTALEHEAVRAGQSTVARRNARQFVPVSESPNPQPEEPNAVGGRIIEPTTGKIDRGPNVESEGRPATWSDEAVLDLAAKGNRAAISQVGVRQLAKKFAGDPRLENIRYVMGDMDYRNLVTSPREVTKFSPVGEPIRQTVARPVGESAPYYDPFSIEGPFPEQEAPPTAGTPIEPSRAIGGQIGQPEGVNEPLPSTTFKGGINPKGIEASTRPISPEESVQSLSGEIDRMKEKLRNGGGRPAAERAALGAKNEIR